MGDKRLRVLLSAYACEPGMGSEPGVGWNLAVHLAKHVDVWVLTRTNNRPAIEMELSRNPVPRMQVVYYDLPRWARVWKRGQRGVQLYYYLWQIGAYFTALRMHREVRFDLIHHGTFVKYWAPSFMAALPPVFIWGPVGGGESIPKAFLSRLSHQGRTYEILRNLARLLGERDPFVRMTARRSRIALATTSETAQRLLLLGAPDVRVCSQVALPYSEIQRLAELPEPAEAPVRFLSLGRLLDWKGFSLGIEAFAASGEDNAEYWIVGDGPARSALERLAVERGVKERVRFFGQLPRSEVLDKLAACHVLVHPSLHESGGWVCAEAMAAGRPVICLDLGGPGLQVIDQQTGIKVEARDPEQAVHDLAAAIKRIAADTELRRQMGEAGRRRVAKDFSWENKAEELYRIYLEVLQRDDEANRRAAV